MPSVWVSDDRRTRLLKDISNLADKLVWLTSKKYDTLAAITLLEIGKKAAELYSFEVKFCKDGSIVAAKRCMRIEVSC
jgi:hypothetical protein